MAFAHLTRLLISVVKGMTQQGFTPNVTLLATGYDPSVFTAGIGGPGMYTTSNYVPYLGSVAQLFPTGPRFP